MLPGSRLSCLLIRPPPTPTLFPYTTLFRSCSKRPSFLISMWTISPGCSRSYRRTGSAGCSAESLLMPSRCRMRLTVRSEEHTSELQSHSDLVCRLLLEKKKEGVSDRYLVVL